MGFFTKIKAALQLSKINARGIWTTEFWSKNIVQLILIYNALYKKNIDPQVAVSIVAGLEAIYPIARSIVKSAILLKEQTDQK